MEKDQIENIKRDAYMKAIKFKNTGLDAEAIYARLEKQGVPEEIAKEVAVNVLKQKLEDEDNLGPKTLNNYSVWQWLWKQLFK